MRIAVLDLGSTTFHLEHFQLVDGQRPQSEFARKSTLCLGEEVFIRGRLEQRSFDKSLLAAEELIDASRERRPDRLAVVATSAVRSAANGYSLIRELECRNRVSVRVLLPDEEARLTYLGQALAPEIAGRRIAAVDLGGGSVEVALGEGLRCDATESLPLGALRVRAALAGAPFDARALSQVQAFVRRELDATVGRLLAFRPDQLMLGSGNARAARRLATLGGPAPGGSGAIDASVLRGSLAAHLDLDRDALVERGVEPRRTGSVLIASAILAELLDLCVGIPAHVSSCGLRDGVALQAFHGDAGKRDCPTEKSARWLLANG